jgi:hypothetical protein
MRRLAQRTATRFSAVLGLVGCAALLATPGALAVHGGETEVTVGSNDAVFSQNKQNEPAVAVDHGEVARADPPLVLAAGANDNIDVEACNVGDDTTCPFTPGVGVTGIQFSLDGGDTWIQPTYTGYSARHCLGIAGVATDTCTPNPSGPIGTLPWYFEEGLVSGGDPAVAFGPTPGSDGAFSWANGSRLYVANLTANFSAERGEQTFKGFEAIGVSRTDDAVAAAAGDKDAWMRPVIASQRQSSATFADKEQIWADNATSSPFFGNVYVCFAQFRGTAFASAPLVVTRSTDGGDTWQQKQVSPAHNVPPRMWGQSGCTVRTDSRGTVYVFYELFQNPNVFLPPVGRHMLVQSFDGGRSWTRPRELYRVTDPCFFVDPVIARCVMDGVAGARNDLSAAPSADIANGAPTGADATDFIAVAWADGRDGQNNEDVMISYSANRGGTFSGPTRISSAPDRGYYAAPALSPDGTDLYVVYNAFTTPFQETTATPRSLVGVVKHAEVVDGAPTGWTEMHRGAPGDPRGSSQNNLVAEFLGDYVYAAATRDYGAAVWNDARNASDCPAIDAWRMSLQTEDTSDDVPRPAPQIACAATFGNSDIFGWSGADPTP